MSAAAKELTRSAPNSIGDNDEISSIGAEASSSSSVSMKQSKSEGTLLCGLPVRYKMMERIGHGSYCDVYRCFDTKTNEMVAVKQQTPQHNAGNVSPRPHHESTVLRFSSKYQGREEHDGSTFVVEYIDEFFDRVRGAFYLVTPYYPLGDLLAYCQDIGTQHVNADNIFGALMGDVLKGIEYLHSIGIAHRDIKPENILIHYDPKLGRETVKICDFGLAQIFPAKSLATNAPGSVFYASPELLVVPAGGYCPFASDIWAFAATVFCVIYGWYPFVSLDYIVRSNEDEYDFRKLYAHIAERVITRTCNTKKMALPKLVSEDVLEIFEDCFVEWINRPTATELLKYKWLDRMPSAIEMIRSYSKPKPTLAVIPESPRNITSRLSAGHRNIRAPSSPKGFQDPRFQARVERSKERQKTTKGKERDKAKRRKRFRRFLTLKKVADSKEHVNTMKTTQH